MGEIGFPRREFLHDIRWWELKSIIRGYNRRRRDLWSATRWQTYNMMCAQVGSKELQKAGIYQITDLLKFPWDSNPQTPISKEEEAELQAEMDAINAQLATEQLRPSEEQQDLQDLIDAENYRPSAEISEAIKGASLGWATAKDETADNTQEPENTDTTDNQGGDNGGPTGELEG